MKNFDIRDSCRSNLNKYTKQAFASLPAMDGPHILDLGCGSGVPSIAILQITNGHILAIDSDKESINRFRQKISTLGCEDRITVVHGSVFSADIKEDFFDIIVAEGLFNIIGFEKGLSFFSKFLKENGFFLIHDDCGNYEKKLSIIAKYHYRIINEIILHEDVWGEEYVNCLDLKIRAYEKEHADREDLQGMFKSEKSEIEMYRNDPSNFRSRYYILQKL